MVMTLLVAFLVLAICGLSLLCFLQIGQIQDLKLENNILKQLLDRYERK